jgi:hypothetical protein
VFHDGDDKEERDVLVVKVDTFDGIGVSGVLVEGKETFTEIFDIFGLDGLEDIEGDKILDKIDKELMVIQDEFKAVIFSLSDCHIHLRPMYRSIMHGALILEEKNASFRKIFIAPFQEGNFTPPCRFPRKWKY